MVTIISETAPHSRKLYIKRAIALVSALALLGLGATAQFFAGDFKDTVTTARAQIENCTIKGVGASIANGDFTLTLPAGCRLAG